jgi:anthranilate synthase/aminodeoxychorismate synthase-like glutamine amidotransferase
MDNPTPRLALIDNYDSFTYNLAQMFEVLGASLEVFRNDAVTVEELASFDGLVISPGPGTPNSAGISLGAIAALSGRLPILGVCLGHQAIGQAFGGHVIRNAPVHGKTAWIHHDYSGPFGGLPNPFEATRYHSLIVERDSLPETMAISAWTHDGLIMGLRHVKHPTFGVQFHPESILTKEGSHLLANFVRRCSRPRLSQPTGTPILLH